MERKKERKYKKQKTNIKKGKHTHTKKRVCKKEEKRKKERRKERKEKIHAGNRDKKRKEKEPNASVNSVSSCYSTWNDVEGLA